MNKDDNPEINLEWNILWWIDSQDSNTWSSTNLEEKPKLTFTEKDFEEELRKNNKQEKTTLTVYMPEHFLHSGFWDLKKKILEDSNIDIIYHLEDDMDIYFKNLQKHLSWSWDFQVDIFMMSTDMIDTFSSNSFKLEFKQELSSFFSYVFKDLFSKNYTFIPYTIDPYISLVSDSANITNSEDEINLKNIKNEILISQKDTWKSQMKVLFGVWNNDISFLKKWNEPYNNYFNYFYEFVYQWYLSKNPEWIKFMMDLATDKVYKTWSLGTMYKYVKFFSKHNSSCKFYPDICIFSYKIGKIKFWLLSDLDIIDQYFNESPKTSKDFHIYNFPTSSNQYPAIGWWFMINKNTDKLVWSSIFINNYIKEWIDWNIFMWKNTLSAFNNILNRQISNKKYSKIRNYANNFKLRLWWKNTKLEFIENTKILDVIWWEVSIKFFLERLDWNLF